MTQTPKVRADRLKPVPPPSPLEPASFTDLIVYGLQGLADGDATPQQQKKVLEWIINQASIAHGLPYQPDSDRNTAFACGRAFVGQQIIGILKIPMMDFAISEQPPERLPDTPQPPKPTVKRKNPKKETPNG